MKIGIVEKKRSIGITIVAIFFALSSLRGLNSSIWSLSDNMLRNFISYYGIIISIISAFLAIGLWSLKEWARKGTICYQIVVTLIGIASIPFSRKVILDYAQELNATQKDISQALNRATITYLVLAVLGVLVALIFIYFLTRPKVKEQFR